MPARILLGGFFGVPLGVLVLGLIGAVCAPAYAQEASAPDARPPKLEARLHFNYERGMAAFSEARYAQAIPELIHVFRDAPDFVRPTHGAAAYWLGQAYALTGQADTAREVWARGQAAVTASLTASLTASDAPDLRLADAFIWGVFAASDSARYGAAASAYLDLLPALEGPLPEALETSLRTRYLAPLALILPKALAESTGLKSAEVALAEPLAAGGGEQLRAWWRREDRSPATPENERLIEHLRRVAEATVRYRDPGAPLGFDDRGQVFIRLGPPSHTTGIRIGQNGVMRDKVTDLHEPSFPTGHLWVYRHVDAEAHYLFIRDRDRHYRLGRPEELLPTRLRARRGTLGALDAMSDIYRMLALYHPQGHYGVMYDRMENYLGLLEDAATARRIAPPAASSAAVPPPAPRATAHAMLASAHADDRRAITRRDETVPAAYSNTDDRVEPLPVALRWARFLDPDGTTRTEVYWSLQTREMLPSRRLRKDLERATNQTAESYEAYLLGLTALHLAEDYTERGRVATQSLIPRVDAEADAVLPVQTLTVAQGVGEAGATEATFNVALQWDAFWARPGDPIIQGPQHKLGAYRIDTLHALSADPGRLEMSDLKPLRLAEGATLDEAVPYPHSAVTGAMQLAVDFEVYHLTYGPDDRTHYRIEYEVTRPGKDRRTTAATRLDGSQRTARETILLDLSDLGGTGALSVTLRVIDETTGQTVARTMDFEVR